jgi:HPt (histidine-containing phosphotransfer) domain-containing protein
MTDPSGHVQGVVQASLDLSWYNGRSVNASLPSGWTLNVVDRDGRILFREPRSDGWVGQLLPETAVLREAILSVLGLGDATGVHRSVHTLKGSAGNFGAPSVIAVAKHLEALASEGNLEACRRAFPELEDRVGELTNALAAELKSSRAS